MFNSSKLFFLLFLFFFACSDEYNDIEPEEPRDLIEILTNDLPAGGEIRKEAILILDDFLKTEEARNSEEYVEYYESMLAQVSTELSQDLNFGIRVWAMYNHGFIIQTPSNVFAFDLLTGYTNSNGDSDPWNKIDFPQEILDHIEILFISHIHGDHWDSWIKESVIANGKEVIYPAEEFGLGTIALAANYTITINGLKIIAHDGLHSAPVRVYEIITPEGFKIIHTGDNQHSNALPMVNDLDVLLLNAWVNESGSQSAVQGMKNCINSMNPRVMIPGHFQELAHDWNPGSVYTRVPYEWGIEVAEDVTNSKVEILTWGEDSTILPN